MREAVVIFVADKKLPLLVAPLYNSAPNGNGIANA